MPEYTFMVTDGPDLGRILPIEAGLTLVGRTEVSLPEDPERSRRMTLIDKTVSRTHAKIELVEPGAPLLTHLSDTNDTFVDGRKIAREALQPGQTVRMGQTTLEVQMQSGWVRQDL